MNMPIVVTLTDSAADHLRQSIAAHEAAIGLRLSIKKTGCSGYMHVPEIIYEINPEDLHHETAGICIFIEANSLELLQGTTIDYVSHGLGQTKLVFHNPNAANLCGCGESFTLVEHEDD